MAKTSDSADVVVVGGAVVGSAIAYYLTLQPGLAGKRVVVVERDPSYRVCATTRSAGGIRQQFSTEESVRMSQVLIDLMRNLAKAPDPGGVDVAFRENGYLLLASEAGRATLAANVAMQRAMGADIVLLAPDVLARRMPWIATDGIAAASLGVSGEGWIDPTSLLQLFRQQARAKGAEFLTDEVVGVEVSGGRVHAARLAGGTRLACGDMVNAAGPAAGALARMAGIALPVEPRKRFVFVVDCRDASAALHRAPLTVDVSGVWFRPEGRQFICGVSPESDAEEPPTGDLDAIDHTLFEARLWPALAARVPAFETLKAVGAWAGHYDYCTLDQNAVIGPHPEIANLYFCNGFSGHGLQHSAAAGRAIAELIACGAFRTLDLSRFGFERIVRGQPLVEDNII